MKIIGTIRPDIIEGICAEGEDYIAARTRLLATVPEGAPF